MDRPDDKPPATTPPVDVPDEAIEHIPPDVQTDGGGTGTPPPPPHPGGGR